jgi:hypothetical protein
MVFFSSKRKLHNTSCSFFKVFSGKNNLKIDFLESKNLDFNFFIHKKHNNKQHVTCCLLKKIEKKTKKILGMSLGFLINARHIGLACRPTHLSCFLRPMWLA